MRILIATGNPAKVREMTAVLSQVIESPGASSQAPLHVEWSSLADLGREVAEPVEDGQSFAEIAALKAGYYSKATGMWALADDSGLEVDALGGEPGVHSAYYAREVANEPRTIRDPANNTKLIQALRGVPMEKRTARFRCCLALADGDRIIATAEGRVEGVIIDEPRGAGGFGYDPHFFVPALNKTTAELSSEEKNQISHRGRALREMRLALVRLFPPLT